MSLRETSMQITLFLVTLPKRIRRPTLSPEQLATVEETPTTSTSTLPRRVNGLPRSPPRAIRELTSVAFYQPNFLVFRRLFLEDKNTL